MYYAKIQKLFNQIDRIQIRSLGFQDYFSLYCPKSCPDPTAMPHRLSKLRKFEIIPQDFSNPFFAELRLKGDMVFIKSNFIDDDPIYLLDA